MRRKLHFSWMLAVFVMHLASCNTTDDGDSTASNYTLSLRECAESPDDTVNLVDTNEKSQMYADRDDGFFGKPTIQAGGYNANFSREVGINIFADTEEELNAGTFSLGSGGIDGGTAYIYYQPTNESGTDFISTDGGVSVNVLDLEFETLSDGSVIIKKLTIDVQNFEVYRFDTDETVCIYQFYLNWSGP